MEIFNAVNVGPPIGQIVFPTTAVGNPELVEERLDQFEIGYRGSVANGKFSWDIAAYRTETKDSIDFYTSETYTAFNPPPDWSLPTFLLPPFGPVALPALFTYRNIGEIVNKGFEVSLRYLPMVRNTVMANYSYQAEREVKGIPEQDIGISPEHRFTSRTTAGAAICTTALPSITSRGLLDGCPRLPLLGHYRVLHDARHGARLHVPRRHSRGFSARYEPHRRRRAAAHLWRHHWSARGV